MKHQCKVTVPDKKLFPELQRAYCAEPESGACPCFEVGQEYLFRTGLGTDGFRHFGHNLDPAFPCAETWDCINRYVYTALQGGSIIHGWMRDDRQMIACWQDGTRPVILRIERIDIPETDEERAWLEHQDFTVRQEDTNTGM